MNPTTAPAVPWPWPKSTACLPCTAPWDRDNQRLTFEVQRGGVTIKTFTNDATWWNRAPLGFVDTTAPPGTSQTYRVRVTDPFGNCLVFVEVCA